MEHNGIKIEKGQLWRIDKKFEEELKKFRILNGDTWKYNNEVIIVQNSNTITPASVLVIPLSLSTNSTFDVEIPMKSICEIFTGIIYAKPINMFSIETQHLTECITKYNDSLISDINEKISEILISKNVK